MNKTVWGVFSKIFEKILITLSCMPKIWGRGGQKTHNPRQLDGHLTALLVSFFSSKVVAAFVVVAEFHGSIITSNWLSLSLSDGLAVRTPADRRHHGRPALRRPQNRAMHPCARHHFLAHQPSGNQLLPRLPGKDQACVHARADDRGAEVLYSSSRWHVGGSIEKWRWWDPGKAQWWADHWLDHDHYLRRVWDHVDDLNDGCQVLVRPSTGSPRTKGMYTYTENKSILFLRAKNNFDFKEKIMCF